MLRFCSVVVLSLFLAAPGLAEEVSGRVRVIDGDTLALAGERIRLHGIDAPESGQTCKRQDGSAWACGRWSRQVLSELVAAGPVTCAGRDRDRYGRLVATCRADGLDLGETMVARGAAFAYRKYSLDYVDAEKRAFLEARGIWQGEAARPESFRRAGAPGGGEAAPGACRIKGNISASGRIYHLPGQEHYADTRISAAKGERWFCSEAEARQAGWRKARR